MIPQDAVRGLWDSVPQLQSKAPVEEHTCNAPEMKRACILNSAHVHEGTANLS